jgi:hypothetical protein
LTGYGDIVVPEAYTPPDSKRGTSLAAFRKAVVCSAFIIAEKGVCRKYLFKKNV